jgi:oxalate decarboxylase/phosphoglucose isomerase-like protein (cupin superfamily)
MGKKSYKPIKANLIAIKRIAKHKRKKVKDMNTPDGKNIFKNIKGHENEINYDLYDFVPRITGFKDLILNMNIIQPGKVGKEPKMTTGHSHANQDEYYFFLKGKGKAVLKLKNKKYTFNVKPHDLLTVPRGYWHRMINAGKDEFVFINVFSGKLPKSRK